MQLKPAVWTKESLHLILKLTLQLTIQFIDIESAFLLIHSIDREFFVKALKESDENPNKPWKLNTSV